MTRLTPTPPFPDRPHDSDAETQVVTVRGLPKSYDGRVVVDGRRVSPGAPAPDAGTVRVLGLDPVRDADRLRPLVGSGCSWSSRC